MNDQIMTSMISMIFLDLNLNIGKKFFNPICPSVAWELQIIVKNSYYQPLISLIQIGLNESKVSVFAKYNIYAYDIKGNRVDICS